MVEVSAHICMHVEIGAGLAEVVEAGNSLQGQGDVIFFNSFQYISEHLATCATL